MNFVPEPGQRGWGPRGHRAGLSHLYGDHDPVNKHRCQRAQRLHPSRGTPARGRWGHRPWRDHSSGPAALGPQQPPGAPNKPRLCTRINEPSPATSEDSPPLRLSQSQSVLERRGERRDQDTWTGVIQHPASGSGKSETGGEEQPLSGNGMLGAG